jgi:hypothetical protein
MSIVASANDTLGSSGISAPKIDRIGAACGIAFTALGVAAVAVVPQSPEYNVEATVIRNYLTTHQRGLGVSTALMGLAALAVIGFFAAVHRRLRAADQEGPLPTTFLIAGSAVATSLILAVVLQAALAQRIAPLADDSTLQAFYALWGLVFHTAPSMGMAVMLLCAAAAIFKSAAYPRWLASIGLLAATMIAVDDTSDLATAGTSLGPLGIVAFILVNVWIVGTSIALLRRRAPRRRRME